MESGRSDHMDEKLKERQERIKARAKAADIKGLRTGYGMLIILAILLLSFMFGYGQYKENKSNKALLTSGYMGNLNKAASSISDIETLLDTARLTKKPEELALIFAKVWKEGTEARDGLSLFNYNNLEIEGSLSFLSDTVNTSYSLMEKTAAGKELTAEEWKKVDDLRTKGADLSGRLNYTLADINVLKRNIEHTFLFEKDTPGNRLSSMASGALSNISDTLYEPSYLKNSTIDLSKPKFLEDAAEILPEQGKQAVEKFLRGMEIGNIEFISKTEPTAEKSLPVYSYDVTLKGASRPSISMDITQMGGYPVWMLNYREIISGNNYISLERAKELAQKFLNNSQYTSMTAIEAENLGSYAIITFIPYVSEIYCYPDSVKVKISLVNGEILGFEGRNYIYSHKERTLNTPKLSKEQASELLSSQLEKKDYRLSLISVNGAEILCHEFKVLFDSNYYSVFLNVDTGKQEKAVRLK